MEILHLIVTIIRRYITSILKPRKIKLEVYQYNTIVYIAKELKIPKEEVLLVFIELGQILAISSQENEKLTANLNKRKERFPEYKN